MAKRSAVPVYNYRDGVGIGQLEAQTGWPASLIKEWIEEDLLVTNENGTISNAEVVRFRADHANLLP